MPSWGSRLRKELSARAARFAVANGLTHYRSRGQTDATILFPGEPATSRHGNFNDESYAAILANASWAKRLEKTHSQSWALPQDRRGDAKDLDSSNSSDALLMNCFCYPGSAERILQGCLQTTPTGPVEFGVGGKVPKRNGKPDRTELDMCVGNIVCEAKLTEPDFTSKRAAVVEAHRDLDDVFMAGGALPSEHVRLGLPPAATEIARSRGRWSVSRGSPVPGRWRQSVHRRRGCRARRIPQE